MEIENKKASFDQSDTCPLFSVIILTYMQRHLLEECLNSVLSQTYPNLELIICDDCSADFDPLEVETYIYTHAQKNLKHVVVYQQTHNVGTVANAQKGVELSSGEFFKLHAGDDRLCSHVVLEQMADIFSQKCVEIIAARSVGCLHDGTITGDYYPTERAFQDMTDVSAQRQFELISTQSWGAYVNAPAVFWKRSLFDEMGGFDLSYRFTEDWPMWLKLTAAGHAITMINIVTTIYRYGGISNDSSEQNLTIGKTHYEESARMLREMALPKFKEAGNIKKMIRCRQAIKCLEVRRDTEGQWERWTTLKKLTWRIREFPFLALSWLYRVRTYGVMWRAKIPLYVIFACVVLFALHTEVWPGVSCQRLWAGIFLLNLAWLLVKAFFTGLLKTFNWVMKLKAGNVF